MKAVSRNIAPAPIAACSARNTTAGRRSRAATTLPISAPTPSPVRYTPSSVPNVNAVPFIVTASTRNHTISSASARRPEVPKMQAQTQKGKLTFEGPPEGGTHRMSAVMRDRNPATAGTTTSAHRTLKSTPTRMLPSSPSLGSRTHVETSAPVAAPRVFTPYRMPITDAARSSRDASARDSKGSDAPMKNVGTSRLPKSSSASAGAGMEAAPNRVYRKS